MILEFVATLLLYSATGTPEPYVWPEERDPAIPKTFNSYTECRQFADQVERANEDNGVAGVSCNHPGGAIQHYRLWIYFKKTDPNGNPTAPWKALLGYFTDHETCTAAGHAARSAAADPQHIISSHACREIK